MKVLLIADRPTASPLREGLQEDSYHVEVADHLEKADYKVQTSDYDLVVLDQGLVRERGHSCLLRWRRGGLKAHVLVLLPVKSDSLEKANCLDAGADAYLVKPINGEELRAHVRALLRRDQQHTAPVRRIHDLEINTLVRSVSRNGKSIHLTPREYELLQFLAFHQGKVVSRSMIREHLYDDQDPNGSNVVDVYIRYLRTKIDKGHEKPLILTRWGQGYLLRGDG